MSDRQWEVFFDILSKIVGMDGSWKEKAQLIREKAEENGATASLEELAEWMTLLDDGSLDDDEE